MRARAWGRFLCELKSAGTLGERLKTTNRKRNVLDDVLGIFDLRLPHCLALVLLSGETRVVETNLRIFVAHVDHDPLGSWGELESQKIKVAISTMSDDGLIV